MPITSLNPYIAFNRTAEKAIRFYETALGATTVNIMRWGEMPGGKIEPKDAGLVMHASIRLGDHLLMMADAHPNMPAPASGNIQIALQYSDQAEMTGSFNALAQGGSVAMPLQDTFWGAHFGMLTDQFGVRWMFNYPLNK
jgi:PhnB protein